MDIQQWEAFKLPEAAEKAGKTENDLLRMAAKGALTLWVWIDPRVRIKNGPYEGWARVPADVLGGLLVYPGEKYGVRVPTLYALDGRSLEMAPMTPQKRRVISLGLSFVTGKPKRSPPPQPAPEEATFWRVRTSHLRVLPDDLERLLGDKRPAGEAAEKQEEVSKPNAKPSRVLVQWGPIADYLGVSEKTAMRWGKENTGAWLRWTDKGHPTTTTAELDILLHGKGKEPR